MGRRAKVNWHGHEFVAETIEERRNPAAPWLMQTKEKGPRWEIDTKIAVRDAEIVEWIDPPEAAPAAPPDVPPL